MEEPGVKIKNEKLFDFVCFLKKMPIFVISINM